jgi:hypothetical protein
MYQPVYVELEILIFVFLYDWTKPVTIIVEENADDGKSTKSVAFSTRKAIVCHGHNLS